MSILLMSTATEIVMGVPRRQFLKATTLAAAAVPLFGPRSIFCAQTFSTPRLYRWFPQFPAPRELWIVPFAGDVEEGMVLESAAGLAAFAAFQGRWKALIYEGIQNNGYQRWIAEYCHANAPRLTPLNLEEAVSRLLAAEVIKGYLLYRFEQSDRPLHSPGKLDESANVATSLAAEHKALVVSERLAKRMDKLGLKQLLDVRDRDELWCLSQHTFSSRVIGTADPKTRNARSLMIALNAFVCCGRGKAYEQALARCDEDSPVLGWGCEGEDKLTIPSSRFGLFQTGTNWCHNLPVLASEAIGQSLPVSQVRIQSSRHWSSLDWGDGSHYVNFTLTDGDNVQWIMGNFTGGSESREFYGNPKRGSFPFTWGLPVASLCQLSPRTLAEVLSRATANDDFIHYNGAGYFYPDSYGKERGHTKALELHAERLRAYMDLTDIRVLAFNFQNWDGADARTACEVIASRLPGLLGIFAFQYYPYSAGNGAIYWVQGATGAEVPVVSCRYTIWASTGRPHDTTPAAVSAQLNQLPRAGGASTQDSFSWVLAHAWSRFRHVRKSANLHAEEADVAQDKSAPDTSRGYDPVSWAVERLEQQVKPVTATELLLRVHLRLRTQATLASWLAEIEAGRNFSSRSPEFLRKTDEARRLLPRANNENATARRCFELIKELHSQDHRG